ncbi:MAG: DNA internalization-related competence protein ComEC/Rec2 [Lachnospiraceae bacterium]|nr:DNA internalization-related competence protein ComEC/Rec2 [Lachnospiraceae bacterium]
MKRPLFLVFTGIVLGELCAIVVNRTGFFVVALFSFFLCTGAVLFLAGKKERRGLFLMIPVIMEISFLLGGCYFLKEKARDPAKDIPAENVYGGVLYGTVESVDHTRDGECKLAVNQVSFAIGTEKYPLRKKCEIIHIPRCTKKIYPGDRILCHGSLGKIDAPVNPGQFSSRIYYYSRNIYYSFSAKKIKRIRSRPFSIKKAAYLFSVKMDNVYHCVFSHSQAAMFKAMVLGDKSELSDFQRELYDENGMAHLLSVSGLHVSIVGGSIFRLLRKAGAGYGLSCIGGGSLLIFYGMIAGLGNSVIRAVIMFGVYLAGEYFGAEYDLISSMSLAGILMLLDSPWRILESGCIISFLSVFAIGYIYPCMKELVERRHAQKLTPGELPTGKKMKKILKETLLGSLVISMVTGPFLLRFYYQWSPWGILLNLIALPLMSPVMISALLGGIFGLAGRMYAFILCVPACVILKGFDYLFLLADQLPGSPVVTGCPPWHVIVFLYLLEILFVFLWYQRKYWKMTVILLFLSALFLVRPEPALKMIMLDVGQGDGILFKMPSEEAVLIDGGSTTRKNVGDKIIIPALKYYGMNHLDYAIITHTDEDHISGVKEMLTEGFPIDHLILPDISGNEKVKKDFSQMTKLAEKNHTQVLKIARGDSLHLGKATFFCLHPKTGWKSEDVNSGSTTLYLKYGRFDALFPGDLSAEQEGLIEKYITRENGKLLPEFAGLSDGICVLKTAHHGSKYSTTKEFLEVFRPGTAILSAGKHNFYGHPHRETIRRLKEADVDIYGTLWGGAIEITSNQKNYHVNYFYDGGWDGGRK